MDIRFIDSQYKELFRIPDGGCVKINLNNGGTLLGKCKYIDDYQDVYKRQVLSGVKFSPQKIVHMQKVLFRFDTFCNYEKD